jgi:hypothetical protein
VLGVFGREGVGLASYWPLNGDESFALGAFRAFRNYDGQGSAFGNTSISAETSDGARAAVYASVDAADVNRVVIVAINRTQSELSAGITVAHPARFETAQVFTLTADGPEPEPGAALRAVDSNAFSYPMPALSVSVIVPEP